MCGWICVAQNIVEPLPFCGKQREWDLSHRQSSAKWIIDANPSSSKGENSMHIGSLAGYTKNALDQKRATRQRQISAREEKTSLTYICQIMKPKVESALFVRMQSISTWCHYIQCVPPEGEDVIAFQQKRPTLYPMFAYDRVCKFVYAKRPTQRRWRRVAWPINCVLSFANKCRCRQILRSILYNLYQR